MQSTCEKTKRLPPCLQNSITKFGAPNRTIADHAGHHKSFEVLSCLRMLWIKLWFSEACHHHQALFKREWQKFKRLVDGLMDRTNTPPQLWFLCPAHMAFVLNRLSDASLQGKQPAHVATGTVGDVSPMLAF